MVINKNIKGKIELFSELCVCPSCVKLIEQFKHYFPNVDIDIISTNAQKISEYKTLIKKL